MRRHDMHRIHLAPVGIRQFPSAEDLLHLAASCNAGNRSWRAYKSTAAEQFIAFVARAPRMKIFDLDLSGDFNAVYEIKMPVPTSPIDGHLQIADHAVFHLRYQESWLHDAPRGWEPLSLLQPVDPFHPNSRPSLMGVICLGNMPRAIPPTEIALLGYYALTLQDLQLDESDPNGVLNILACDFYRSHPEYVPLTRAGLFEPLEGSTT